MGLPLDIGAFGGLPDLTVLALPTQGNLRGKSDGN
jgi:hypothetical protein